MWDSFKRLAVYDYLANNHVMAAIHPEIGTDVNSADGTFASCASDHALSELVKRNDETGDIAREVKSIGDDMDSLLTTLNGFLARHA